MKRLTNRFMKKLTLYTTVSVLALGLVACEPGYNVPGSTVAGVATGGLIGGLLFHGSAAGIVGGAILGGIVGNKVGQSMDRRDRLNMQNATVRTPIGEEATWTNKGATYVVTPVKEYGDYSGGRYCRKFKTRIKVDGEWTYGRGKVCRNGPDDKWKIQ